MEPVLIHDKLFVPYISSEAIDVRVKALAKEINVDYEDRNPLFIAVLTGSFVFAADLFRNITTPAEICFVKLSSYDGMSSTGNVVTQIGLNKEIKERHVIVLEDIIDTGKTLYEFMPSLEQQQPASLKLACLLSKPDALKYDLQADYTGFIIPDNFVVGYGLDYDGLGRNLPAIYTLSNQ
jgi:hypoxanthine phosphoribosyltransferase